MKDKKYTTAQRLAVLEKTVGMMWNVMKLQGQEIKKLIENKDK
tara:strand:+ start:1006 stop:1134 length:129 start_codon:yes stop_codon:yes gene_type:complete